MTSALLRRRGRVRISGDEMWVDHRCLFHDDAFASASWQEGTGVYYCRTEDRVFAVPAVMDALFVGERSRQAFAVDRSATASGNGAVAKASRPPERETVQKAPKDKRLARVFEYRFPDGRLSHRKYRVGDGPGKTIWQEGPAGESSLAGLQTYPVYGDQHLEAGLHLFVVEGEKCVDLIADVAEQHRDVAIAGVTAGSSADLRHSARFVAQRLRDLAPATLTLWPDNDEAGLRAMDALAAELLVASVPHYVLDPNTLGLPAKGDAVDYILAGGRLADLVHKTAAPKSNGSLDDLVGRLAVTNDGHVMFPQTRNLVSINDGNARAIWYHQLHAMPKDAQAKELSARLEVKAHIMPTAVKPRQHNTDLQTWWRPRTTGPAYLIDAEGVRLADDPPETILLVPTDEITYPTEVDLDGSRQDLLDLAKSFHLSETETIMAEGWLCCALAGLQTPIMFMRAPAGTGKTTLARLLLAVVEPLCPELDSSKRQNPDIREFVQQMRNSRALLLDNVSKLDSQLEDQLAKLVTGYTTALRPLYSERVVTTRIHRALIITTTSYDVYKGDLAQRMIVTSPTTEHALRWLPDSVAQERFRGFIPRIRGWIFSRLVEYYRARVDARRQPQHLRIADLGLMLSALGYDTDKLARHESGLKAEVIAQDDPWLECLVALWKDRDRDMFWISTADLLQYMRDFGLKELPPEKSPRLARYIAEKNPIVRDHGFTIEKHNETERRGWGFSIYQPTFDDVIRNEASTDASTPE